MLTLPQATALGPLEYALMRIVWAHGVPMQCASVAAERQAVGPPSSSMRTRSTSVQRGILRPILVYLLC
jgi:hypothetical protein